MQGYLTSQGASPDGALHQAYGLLGQGLNAQARLWSMWMTFGTWPWFALVVFRLYLR